MTTNRQQTQKDLETIIEVLDQRTFELGKYRAGKICYTVGACFLLKLIKGTVLLASVIL